MKQRMGRAPWDKKSDLPPKQQPQQPSSSSSSSSSARSPSLPKALLPDLCVYGRHAVDATLRFQAQRADLLFHTDNKDLAPLVELAARSGIKTRLVDHATTDALAGGRAVAVAQGIVLSCQPFPFASVEDFEKAPGLTLVLDGVEDPRNLGAAVRAAYALGAGLVVIPADRAATATASASKASAGALCRVPLARATNLRRALEILKEKGAWIVGAEADGDASPWQVDMTGPTVVVIGGEDRGLRRLTREACDHVVSIPMAAKDMSLNAADAATLLLYEALRQRRTRLAGGL
jgi:23S rRNA (guanosine2251-2'-O)-methyltransferase